MILFQQQPEGLIVGTGVAVDNGKGGPEHAQESNQGNEQFGPGADGKGVHFDQLADIGNTGCLDLFTAAVLDQCPQGHEDQGKDCRTDVAHVEVEDAILETDRIQAAFRNHPHGIQRGDFNGCRHPAHQGHDKAERCQRPGIGCHKILCHGHTAFEGCDNYGRYRRNG